MGTNEREKMEGNGTIEEGMWVSGKVQGERGGGGKGGRGKRGGDLTGFAC